MLNEAPCRSALFRILQKNRLDATRSVPDGVKRLWSDLQEASLVKFYEDGLTFFLVREQLAEMMIEAQSTSAQLKSSTVLRGQYALFCAKCHIYLGSLSARLTRDGIHYYYH